MFSGLKKISMTCIYVHQQYALLSFIRFSSSFSDSLLCWVRSALARYIPCLGVLLCVPHGERLTSSSFMSTRRSTVTSQASEIGSKVHQSSRTRLSSMSDSESVWTHLNPSITAFLSLVQSVWSWDHHFHSVSLCLSQALTDTEVDVASALSRQVSYEGRKEVSDFKHGNSLKVKVRGRDSGGFRSPVDTGLNLTGYAYISVSMSLYYWLCSSSHSYIVLQVMSSSSREILQSAIFMI